MTSTSDGHGRNRLWLIVAGVTCGFLVVALAIGVIAWSRPSSNAKSAGSGSPISSSPSTTSIPVPKLTEAQLAKLTIADTDHTVKNGQVDLTSTSGGLMARVAKAQAVFARPGSEPIAVVPAEQIGSQTWLPILDRRDGWARVRLPSRPNGVTAWIPLDGLQLATTAWQVKVALSTGEMTISKGEKKMGTWQIGQGKEGTPTPIGQTFLLAGFVDTTQSFSPIIYALGVHSDTLDTYGGGPGTVAVHGWPTQAGRIGRVSHGCVRVPEGALEMFRQIPVGTPVDITA